MVILFKKSQNLIFLVFCICSHVFCHKVVKSFICSLGLVIYGIFRYDQSYCVWSVANHFYLKIYFVFDPSTFIINKVIYLSIDPSHISIHLSLAASLPPWWGELQNPNKKSRPAKKGSFVLMLLLYNLFFTLAERSRLSSHEFSKEKLRISLLEPQWSACIKKKKTRGYSLMNWKKLMPWIGTSLLLRIALK